MGAAKQEVDIGWASSNSTCSSEIFNALCVLVLRLSTVLKFWVHLVLHSQHQAGQGYIARPYLMKREESRRAGGWASGRALAVEAGVPEFASHAHSEGAVANPRMVNLALGGLASRHSLCLAEDC